MRWLDTCIRSEILWPISMPEIHLHVILVVRESINFASTENTYKLFTFLCADYPVAPNFRMFFFINFQKNWQFYFFIFFSIAKSSNFIFWLLINLATELLLWLTCFLMVPTNMGIWSCWISSRYYPITRFLKRMMFCTQWSKRMALIWNS